MSLRPPSPTLARLPAGALLAFGLSLLGCSKPAAEKHETRPVAPKAPSEAPPFERMSVVEFRATPAPPLTKDSPLPGALPGAPSIQPPGTSGATPSAPGPARKLALHCVGSHLDAKLEEPRLEASAEQEDDTYRLAFHGEGQGTLVLHREGRRFRGTLRYASLDARILESGPIEFDAEGIP